MGKVLLFIVLSIFLVGSLVPSSEGAATREILKSNRKDGKTQATTALAEARTCTQLEKLLNLVISLPSIVISIVGNFTGGLGDLFMKPGGGGIQLPDKGCSPIDPLLLANIPGIFIGVPIVILGIAAIIAIVVAIVIAIGGGGGSLRHKLEEMMGLKGNDNDEGGYGYAPSMGSAYGVPVSSSYGSPVAPGTPYSRLSHAVDTATHDFNKAYDKYSALMTQPQPQQPVQSPVQSQQSSSGSVYFDSKPTQYDAWNNNNEVMKRMKH